MSLKSQDEDSDKLKKYSLEEYFELESQSEMRHEYHDGYIIECAYTSENHGIIIHNLDFLLGGCLRKTDCQVFTSDRLLYAESCKSFYYPDILIVCGEKENYQYSKNMVATKNPTVLIEVLSNSTYDIDKTLKMQCYRKIPSLKQYILVEQDIKMVQVFEKDKNNKRWSAIIYEDDNDTVKIGDCELPISEIYYKVDLIKPDSASD
jgi:Uma2 family endonuclease